MRLRSLVVLIAIALTLALTVRKFYFPASQPVTGSESTPPARISNEGAVTPSVASRNLKKKRDASADDWFREVTEQSGVRFLHVSGDSPEKPFPAANGSGLAAIDFDLDGLYDLYFATGASIPVVDTESSPQNRIYRNLGEWHFEDITDMAGLGHRGYSAGLAVGDFDSDGFPDIYVACYGPNCLFRNMGDGTFQEVGTAARVADDRWATSTGFLDYDADGLLDIYVCNYGIWSPETNQYCGDRTRGVRMFCSPTSIEPQQHALYRNAGEGAFENATDSSGIGVRRSRGQGVIAADVTEDGLIDLYIGNDLHPNSLFINVGGGRFRDMSEASGTAYDAHGSPQAGMGVDAVDANGDARFDLFVTNFQNENNCLYENMGNELFREASYSCGLATTSIPWVGWGTAFADFDFDGWPDVVVTNGHVDDNRHMFGEDVPFFQPALVWKNVRGQFRLLGPEAGDYFSVHHVGRGLIVADLDNDGDQDVGISHQDAVPALLINQIGSAKGTAPSVVLRLVGTASNRDAVGSLVTFHSKRRSVVAQVKGGGSYLSASDLRLFFAVLPEEDEFEIDVRWPNGERSSLSGIEKGNEYLIVQNDSNDASVFPLKEMPE